MMSTRPAWDLARAQAFPAFSRQNSLTLRRYPQYGVCLTMKSREDHLNWAKQRALICVDMGHFSDAVASLRADLAENPLTKGVVSSEHAMRGYKAAMDAALGRGSQALTEWIEGLR
jgi:hypothetical protein